MYEKQYIDQLAHLGRVDLLQSLGILPGFLHGTLNVVLMTTKDSDAAFQYAFRGVGSSWRISGTGVTL